MGKGIPLGRTQRVRVGGQLSEEVRLMCGVPQGSVLGSLLFLAYSNDIWRNTVSTIRLFADDCVIHECIKIINNEDIESCRNIWTGWESGRQKMR